MTDVTKVSVTATAETAVKKLKKAEIGIYDCKKDGAKFTFFVKDKHLKKVFAIFSNPCYNIKVAKESRRGRLLKSVINRVGLIVGALAFIAIAAFSNAFVLKIEVDGSGSYLSPEIKRIVYESGAKEFKLFKGFDTPAATGKILALPQVTFCNIEKKGSILRVDVQVDEEHSAKAVRTPLVSDRDGVVKNIVAICGTAVVSIGAQVKKGDTLISAVTYAGEQEVESIAVGYAELECREKCEYFAPQESDENLRLAYSSVQLYADEILTRSHTVKSTEGGVIYVIDFTYLHKLSINIK
ncbi:MAG: sporulation protein YqfD [Clostridia bacterium]|nr:sporulation protein YqfD [Clostridia bacterium]